MKTWNYPPVSHVARVGDHLLAHFYEGTRGTGKRDGPSQRLTQVLVHCGPRSSGELHQVGRPVVAFHKVRTCGSLVSTKVPHGSDDSDVHSRIRLRLSRVSRCS